MVLVATLDDSQTQKLYFVIKILERSYYLIGFVKVINSNKNVKSTTSKYQVNKNGPWFDLVSHRLAYKPVPSNIFGGGEEAMASVKRQSTKTQGSSDIFNQTPSNPTTPNTGKKLYTGQRDNDIFGIRERTTGEVRTS